MARSRRGTLIHYSGGCGASNKPGATLGSRGNVTCRSCLRSLNAPSVIDSKVIHMDRRVVPGGDRAGLPRSGPVADAWCGARSRSVRRGGRWITMNERITQDPDRVTCPRCIARRPWEVCRHGRRYFTGPDDPRPDCCAGSIGDAIDSQSLSVGG